MTATSQAAEGTGRLLSGWGRTTASRARVAGPMELERLQDLVASRPAGGVLARGAGCSYGDAAQNAGGCVLDPATRPGIDVDAAAGTARLAAATTFTELLTRIVPYGLLPPVLPGTSHLTVGGAVAADVHGKNQRRHGSISGWIEEIELIDGTGERRTLTPGGDAEAFRATVGGMGMTGIILAVTIRLLRVRSALLRVTTRRLPDLDALLDALDRTGAPYAVAWIDTTASGRSLGRGIIDTGDHLANPDPAIERYGLVYRPGRARRVPPLPACPVTSWSARGFNTLWFRKAPGNSSEITDLATFFHRLDTIDGWNRMIGPRGFVQYQFVVPDGAHQIIAEVLEAVQRHRCAPFLGTVKRFGPGSGSHLSFPMPGWSLAIDMPAGNRWLGPVLHDLDLKVAAAGGRVYLAKDSRLSRSAFDAMYRQLPEWRAAASKLDPAGVFRSDLGRRVGLC